MSAPDAPFVARFVRDLAAACGHVPATGAPIALAVSGGADSMAMLALAAAAYPGAVIAATVDHGLRPAAGDEARLVADWCAQQAVPHATLGLAKPLGRTGIQADARTARYDVLARWSLDSGAVALATAHHADDQAETFLMRAVRGAGPSGLAGIRRRRPLNIGDRHAGYPRCGVAAACDQSTVTLVRPLLGWRRAELRALAEQNSVPFIDDPSNFDRHFERVRLRQLLDENDWLDAAGLSQAAANAAEAAAAIDDFAAWLWRARKIAAVGVPHPDNETWLDMADLPRELIRRLARAAIHDVRLVNGITRPSFDDAANIEPLLDSLTAGRTATHAGIIVSRKATVWRFCEAPLRRTH